MVLQARIKARAIRALLLGGLFYHWNTLGIINTVAGVAIRTTGKNPATNNTNSGAEPCTYRCGMEKHKACGLDPFVLFAAVFGEGLNRGRLRRPSSWPRLPPKSPGRKSTGQIHHANHGLHERAPNPHRRYKCSFLALTKTTSCRTIADEIMIR
jgi:hypothetical protein